MAARMRFHHFKVFAKNGWKFTQKMVNNLQFQLFAFKKLNDYNHWVLRNGTAIFVVTENRQAGDGLPDHEHDDSSPDFSSRLGSVSRIRPRPRPTPTFTSHSDPLKYNKSSSRYNDERCVYAASSGSNCMINGSYNGSIYNNNNINGKIKGLENANVTSYTTGTHIPEGRNNLPTDEVLQNYNYCCESGFSKSKLASEEKRYIDSVYDVAFHVQNVQQSFEKAVHGGAEPVCEPRTIEDEQGEVSIASVCSCVGDVVHTLLNTENYKGIFLPGFSEYVQCSHQQDDHPLQVHFDHVTYACPIGDSERVLDWYENCFGMKRFKINSNEDDDEGFIVRGDNVGMRLKAMEYWRCSKVGFVATDQGRDLPTNFVIAEALPGHGENQIETFLREHNGAGVQHIGLHTPDLVHAAGTLQESGVEFIQPPEAYYTEVGKLDEILEVGEEVAILQKHGILLDAEADVIKSYNEEISTNQRYLMQVFTKPLFNEDTFFLEYIQRCGATGFGAGNITALWRAVQQYMDHPSDKQ